MFVHQWVIWLIVRGPHPRTRGGGLCIRFTYRHDIEFSLEKCPWLRTRTFELHTHFVYCINNTRTLHIHLSWRSYYLASFWDVKCVMHALACSSNHPWSGSVVRFGLKPVIWTAAVIIHRDSINRSLIKPREQLAWHPRQVSVGEALGKRCHRFFGLIVYILNFYKIQWLVYFDGTEWHKNELLFNFSKFSIGLFLGGSAVGGTDTALKPGKWVAQPQSTVQATTTSR